MDEYGHRLWPVQDILTEVQTLGPRRPRDPSRTFSLRASSNDREQESHGKSTWRIGITNEI